MKISVVIPCIARHFKYLWRSLDSLTRQTVAPDEVIVRICEAGSIPQEYIDKLSDRYSKSFSRFCILIEHGSAYSGPNRQISSEQCTGDIIVYQDADDSSHIQRLEVLRKYFDETDAVHIAHTYKYMDQVNDDPIDINSIKVFPADRLYKYFFPNGNIRECASIRIAYSHPDGFGTHGGAVAIRKEVLERVHWKHPSELVLLGTTYTEDYEFDMDVLFLYKRSILLNADLYFYNVSSDRLVFDTNNFGM